MPARNESEAPCPNRIIDDCGQAFVMGAAGGAVFHFFKGMKNSPRGQRMYGGYVAMSHRAPALGGGFAVWGGLFSMYNCALMHARGKEDIWNAVAAGGLVGGTLAARAGKQQARRGALIGAGLLFIIEGMMLMAGKAFSEDPAAARAPLSLEENMPTMLESLTAATGGDKKPKKKSQAAKDVLDDFAENYALRDFVDDLVGFQPEDRSALL